MYSFQAHSSAQSCMYKAAHKPGPAEAAEVGYGCVGTHSMGLGDCRAAREKQR